MRRINYDLYVVVAGFYISIVDYSTLNKVILRNVDVSNNIKGIK